MDNVRISTRLESASAHFDWISACGPLFECSCWSSLYIRQYTEQEEDVNCVVYIYSTTIKSCVSCVQNGYVCLVVVYVHKEVYHLFINLFRSRIQAIVQNNITNGRQKWWLYNERRYIITPPSSLECSQCARRNGTAVWFFCVVGPKSFVWLVVVVGGWSRTGIASGVGGEL